MGGEKRIVGITDTTLRDGHQSLLATRMKTEHMIPIAEKMDEMGFHSLEVWGGATFDTCMRFLNENPWDRLKTIRKAFKKTKLQMLLRGQNLVGYKHYADDVVEAFVAKAAEHGIDIFRIFDALNDVRNMQKAIEEVKKNGKHVQATISYTTGEIYNLDYYLNLAGSLKDMGADSICIKDMAGILEPYTAYELVKALKEKINLPIQMHTHYTSGMGAMMYIKAIEAGADVIDTANSALAMGTSQPATETMVAVLNNGPFETGIDLEKVTTLADYFKDVRANYAKFDVYKAGVDVNVLRYQVPGGMLSNFISQLSQQNALNKLDDVLQEVPRVRADLGYPPLVTPSSQIVGTQAVLNVLTGERYKMVTNEVKNYLRGLYGQAPGTVNEDIRRKIIGDEKPISVRPGDLIEPQMENARQEIGNIADTTEKLLMYVLFPQVAKDFFAGKIVVEDMKGDTKAPVEAKKEIKVEKQEPVKTASFATKLMKEKNKGTVNFVFSGRIDNLNISLDGSGGLKGLDNNIEERFEKDESLTEVEVNKVTKNENLTQVGEVIKAPMPGKIVKVLRGEGDAIETGDTILILEAMKMENQITVNVSGKITKMNVKDGDIVNPGDIMAVIA